MPVSKCEIEVKKELERTEERIAKIDEEISALQTQLRLLMPPKAHPILYPREVPSPRSKKEQ